MSRQFDVVRNPDAEDAVRRPFLVVLQSDLVSGLRSTVVAPLLVREAIVGASRLHPVVKIDDTEMWFATHELFAIEQRLLGKPVANLESQRDALSAALDFLFLGY